MTDRERALHWVQLRGLEWRENSEQLISTLADEFAAVRAEDGREAPEELRLLREVASDARETVSADEARIKHGRAPGAECRLKRSIAALDDFDKARR